jgi:hypothetical protein
MSIIIRTQPPLLTPVYNPMIIACDSTNQTQESFSFVADIKARGTTVTRMKVPVNPQGYGVFDIQRHIENSVSFDFNPNQNYFSVATQSMATYSVSFSEEYRYFFNFYDNTFLPGGKVGFVSFIQTSPLDNIPLLSVDQQIVVEQTDTTPTNPSYNGIATITGITYSNAYDGNDRWLIETDVNYGVSSPVEGGKISLANFELTTVGVTASITEQDAFNGVLSFLDEQTWDYTDYMATSTSPYGEFLTNTPDGYELDINDRMWLNLYQRTNSSTNFLYIQTNNGTYSVTNTFNTPATIDQQRLLRVGVGPYQLTNATASISVISGTLPIITSTTKEISIYTKNAGGFQTIATKTFKIKDKCSKYEKIQLVFLDKLGSFIPFTFELVNKHNLSITRAEYQQHYGQYAPASNNWKYNTWDRGKKSLDTQVVESYTINSNWVNQSTSDYLMELFTSPEVYWIKENGTTIAISITSNQTERKQTINDQIINYQLTFEISNKNNQQRG